MTSGRLYVQLGKFGDILNILPLCYQEFQAGKKPTLMVGEKYASLLDGVTYVDRLVHKGDIYDLRNALAEAKKTGMEVVCPQVLGQPEDTRDLVYAETAESKAGKAPQAMTDSWQKESYRAAGRWAEWRKQPPLVIDNRDTAREDALVEKILTIKRRAILVSTAGETAPFKHKRLLLGLLTLQFKKNSQIIDLDSVKAERIYDLLGLFDRARILFAADSALLHLARASKVPVVALVNDKPSPWHGSAWRPNYHAFIRYSTFPERAMDVVDLVDSVDARGSYFKTIPEKRLLIHVWSRYEITEENEGRCSEARRTWVDQYHGSGNWAETAIDVGVFGRDSSTGEIKDASRFPFVQDVFQVARMRAKKDDDLIIWTSAETCFEGNLAKLSGEPTFGYRMDRGADGDTYVARPDFFAFTAKWWDENRTQYPDMIMGPDSYWSRTLRDLIRSKGGVETVGAVYRKGVAS